MLGPGSDFFDILFTQVDREKFVVEDIGRLRKETVDLREKYNLPGAKIFEYTFNFYEGKDVFLTTGNSIVYPGNHDNNTICGWYNDLSSGDKRVLDNYLADYNGNINEKVIKHLMNHPYKYLIVMIQDILGQGKNARINIPGTQKNQWKYRLTSLDGIYEKLNKILED